MTNREVEDLAIQLVLDREHAAGRRATDSRGRGALADIEATGSSRSRPSAVRPAALTSGWKPRQVDAALADPDRFHLVVVENIRSGQPRIIDIHGERLASLLIRRREKHYFEVPFPTGLYDSLVSEADG